MKKLSRDYFKNPLNYRENPNITDVKYLYLKLNLTAN